VELHRDRSDRTVVDPHLVLDAPHVLLVVIESQARRVDRERPPQVRPDTTVLSQQLPARDGGVVEVDTGSRRGALVELTDQGSRGVSPKSAV
jgi:hypothetical protein